MIEIEKKFILSREEEESLLKGAESLGEKVFTDIYYDDADYSLTKKDIWLRNRSDAFELKVPLDGGAIGEREADRYRELETEEEIKDYFKADEGVSLEAWLSRCGYFPFCEITTARRKYRKEGYNIDLDSVDFGYSLAEIERMVEEGSDLDKVSGEIIAFAEKHGIKAPLVIYGKVVEYLKRNKPEHFQALVKEGIVKA